MGYGFVNKLNAVLKDIFAVDEQTCMVAVLQEVQHFMVVHNITRFDSVQIVGHSLGGATAVALRMLLGISETELRNIIKEGIEIIKHKNDGLDP